MTNKADQKRSNRYSRTKVRANLTEKIGEPVIDYTLDDTEGAEVFPIEHPFFRSESTKEALKPLADDDEEGIAEAVLNGLDPKGWEKFTAAGGEAGDVTHLLLELSLETNDALSAGRPTKR